MTLKTEDIKRPRLNDVLLVLAALGVFAAFDVIGHRHAPYFWPKLTLIVAFSMACLLFTREREALNAFSAVVAALSTLCAVAMTAGDRTNPNWWPFFLGFVGATVLFTLLTRNRRGTLLAIASLVGFRLLIFAVLYAFHR